MRTTLCVVLHQVLQDTRSHLVKVNRDPGVSLTSFLCLAWLLCGSVSTFFFPLFHFSSALAPLFYIRQDDYCTLAGTSCCCGLYERYVPGFGIDLYDSLFSEGQRKACTDCISQTDMRLPSKPRSLSSAPSPYRPLCTTTNLSSGRNGASTVSSWLLDV